MPDYIGEQIQFRAAGVAALAAAARPNGDVEESEHLAIRMLEYGRGLSGASRHPLPCRYVATATKRLSDLSRVCAMHLLFLPGNGERVKNSNCTKLLAKIKELQEQDPDW